MKKIFVSRHQGAYDWFQKHHKDFAKDCEFKTHILENEIRGNIIIGTLPINLAVLACEYYHLSMIVPSEMRGKELTLEDMEKFNCKIQSYQIKKI